VDGGAEDGTTDGSHQDGQQERRHGPRRDQGEEHAQHQAHPGTLGAAEQGRPADGHATGHPLDALQVVADDAQVLDRKPCVGEPVDQVLGADVAAVATQDFGARDGRGRGGDISGHGALPWLAGTGAVNAAAV
jgi:hypothetical protein